MKYWERWIGDWKKKTAHLSAEAKGIYGELLDHQYATHRPLPLEPEELYRIAGASTPSEKKTADRVIGEFFVKEEVGYVNARAQEEIQRREKYVGEQRERGLRGVEVRLGRTIARDTGEIQEPLNGSFVQFWNAYPKKINRVAAEQLWISLAPDDDLSARIIKAVALQRRNADWTKEGGRYIPTPANWLQARRWEDEQAEIELGTCKYCERPAVAITNGIHHCATPRHIDHAQGRY